MKHDENAEKTAWRRPPGVSQGIWRYVHQGAIATRYDDFVATTPLCRVDLEVLAETFPPIVLSQKLSSSSSQPNEKGSSVTTRVADLQSESASTTESSIDSEGSLQKGLVLDLGCGTGRASAILSRHGYRVMAIDLSLPMLNEVAARRLPETTLLHANLVELDCLHENTAAGAVCLFSTLGMIQGRSHRRRFLAHVRRIVRPGGRFLLHVHHRYAALTTRPGIIGLGRSAIAAATRPDRQWGDSVYAYRGLPDMFLHQFSRRELLSDLHAARWRVARWLPLSADGSEVLNRRFKIAGGFLVVVD